MGSRDVATLEHDCHNAEDDRVGAALRTPYDRGFVDELKSTVPARSRAWDPDERSWWVDAEHVDIARGLMLRYWSEILVVGDGEILRLNPGN